MSPRFCCGRHWDNFTCLFEHRMKCLICPLHGHFSRVSYEKMEKIRQKTLQAMNNKKLQDQDEQNLKIKRLMAKSAKSSTNTAPKIIKSPMQLQAQNIPGPSDNKPVRSSLKKRTAVAASLVNQKRVSPLKLVKRSNGNAKILKKDSNDKLYRPIRTDRANQQTRSLPEHPHSIIHNTPDKSVLTRGPETHLSIQMTTATTPNQSTNISSNLPKSPEPNFHNQRHHVQSSGSGTEITNTKSASEQCTPALKSRNSPHITMLGLKFGCSECDKTYKFRNSAVFHISNKHVPSNHKCETCDKEFGAEWRLKVHQELRVTINGKLMCRGRGKPDPNKNYKRKYKFHLAI